MFGENEKSCKSDWLRVSPIGAGYTGILSLWFLFMIALFFAHLTGRQWNWPSLGHIGQFSRRGCLTGKMAHANPHAFSLGITPELFRCAVHCPCTDTLLVWVSSICTLCNIFHLSSGRSATALQSQNLVKTHYFIYLFILIFCSFPFVDFYCSRFCWLSCDSDSK